MLVDQKVYIDGEKKIHVVNKFDHSVAAEVARMTEREGGGKEQFHELTSTEYRQRHSSTDASSLNASGNRA